MKNCQERALKVGLSELKVNVRDIDLLQNESVVKCTELDLIKENTKNTIMLIEEVLKVDLKK